MAKKIQAYTVAQFCAAHGISRATFYVLQKRNAAPAVMRVGRRVLVTRESAKAWREKMTRACSDENERER